MSNNGKEIEAPDYNKIIKGIELIDVFLVSHNGKLTDFAIESDKPEKKPYKQIEPRIDENFDYKRLPNNGFAIYYTFKLVGVVEEEQIVEMEFTFVSLLQSKEMVPDEFIERFKNTAKTLSYPYLREVVASMTQRMSLPKLTLPLVILMPPGKDRKPRPQSEDGEEKQA